MQPDTNLARLLAAEWPEVEGRWRGMIFGAYPSDTASFLEKKKDQFDNPVGYAVRQMTEGVLRGIIAGASPAELAALMEPVVRIRAIQSFKPSGAMAFVFALKDAVREHVMDQKSPETISAGDLIGFFSEVDAVALLAFDYYMDSREKLHEVRHEELKNNMYMLLRQANQVNTGEGP